MSRRTDVLLCDSSKLPDDGTAFCLQSGKALFRLCLYDNKHKQIIQLPANRYLDSAAPVFQLLR